MTRARAVCAILALALPACSLATYPTVDPTLAEVAPDAGQLAPDATPDPATDAATIDALPPAPDATPARDAPAEVDAADVAPSPADDAAPAPNGAGDRDAALLRAFVQAGDVGVETPAVRNLLGGAHGRAIPVALGKWAVRVRLAEHDRQEVCVQSRTGGKRGWALTSGALAAAKIMGNGAGT